MGDSIPLFAPIFHPGSTQASGAVPVMLDNANDSRIDIDITVQAVAARRVSGQVTGGGPSGAAELTLLLFPQNDLPEASMVSQIVPVSVSADGTFDFVGVPPGRYLLEAFPKARKQGPWASIPVTVGGRDIGGLVVPLGSGTTVTGRVEFSGAAARRAATALEGLAALLPVGFCRAAPWQCLSAPGLMEAARWGAQGRRCV